MNTVKNTTEKWSGTYKGVGYEIYRNHHKNYVPNLGIPESWWTHYIIIHIDRIPEENNPQSFWLEGRKSQIGSMVHYDYHEHPISAIDFHGGCTFYDKIRGFDGDKKVIKVGCDYQHSWDEGKEYSLEYVEREVVETIDSFRELVPEYKYCCCGNGKLYSESEGLVRDDGYFCSIEYYGKEEWFKLGLAKS